MRGVPYFLILDLANANPHSRRQVSWPRGTFLARTLGVALAIEPPAPTSLKTYIQASRHPKEAARMLRCSVDRIAPLGGPSSHF